MDFIKIGQMLSYWIDEEWNPHVKQLGIQSSSRDGRTGNDRSKNMLESGRLVSHIVDY